MCGIGSGVVVCRVVGGLGYMLCVQVVWGESVVSIGCRLLVDWVFRRMGECRRPGRCRVVAWRVVRVVIVAWFCTLGGWSLHREIGSVYRRG